MPSKLTNMATKIDKVLYLAADRMSVDVTGPISDWDDDAVGAVFTVVLSQVADAGTDEEIVTAIGASGMFATGDKWWATAAVIDRPDNSVTTLRPGGAIAAAYVTIANADGGSEWYAWTLPVR